MGKPKTRHNRTSTKGKVFPAGRGCVKVKGRWSGYKLPRKPKNIDYIDYLNYLENELHFTTSDSGQGQYNALKKKIKYVKGKI